VSGGPRLAFIGSCQAVVMARLAERMVAGCSATAMDFGAAEGRDPTLRERFRADLDGCDHVFVQPNHMSPLSWPELAATLPPGRLVRIGMFYFRGPLPDICYVGRFGTRVGPIPYNSVVVLGSFLRGLDERECLAQFTEERFQSLGLFDAWSDSLAALDARNAGADFPITRLVDEVAWRNHAFYTVNHPAAWLLERYLAEVFASLGLRHQRTALAPAEDPLNLPQLPTWDFVAARLRLDWRSSQRVRVPGKAWWSLEEYIARFYAHYAKRKREALVVSSPADLLAALRRHAPEWLPAAA
jgi:hypothetical protein